MYVQTEPVEYTYEKNIHRNRLVILFNHKYEVSYSTTNEYFSSEISCH